MKQTISILFVLLAISFANTCEAQQVREYIDLQMHPTMHMSYKFFKTGFHGYDEEKPPKLKPKHTFTNVNYARFWQNNPGARIIVDGLILREFEQNPERARKLILDQIAYIEDFAKENSDKFVVAKSPREVRDLLKTTDKTIIVHSVEGARPLINSQADADFWASKGIAFMTLIHLVDDEYGGAGIRPGLITEAINLKGTLKRHFHPKKPRGLTPKGKQAILWLANAGILTDLTHMSDSSRKDALALMEKHQIPPLVTHDVFKPIQNNPRGVETGDVIRIYQNGGLFSTPISGESLVAYKPSLEYKAKLDSLKKHCPGSIDSYKFTYLSLKEFVEKNAWRILGEADLTFDELSENRKVDLAIGFQTDFNGWLNHSRPRYGKDGCWPLEENKSYEPIETEGMPHPGLLDSHWKLLEKEGVDLSPLKRSAEKFLQMWEGMLERKGSFGQVSYPE